jgi:hypothetical protein
MSESTIFAGKELRNEEITQPPGLNVDSKGTIDIGTTRTSLASFDNIGYYFDNLVRCCEILKYFIFM